MAAKRSNKPRPPRKRSPKKGGGMLMGMRTGFRRMTGVEAKKSADEPQSPLRRTLFIALLVVIGVVIAWGIAKR